MSFIIGVPKETLRGEKRVAATAESIKKFIERGIAVRVEPGAGVDAGITDEAFTAAGATLGNAWDCDAVFKVRPPTSDEAANA